MNNMKTALYNSYLVIFNRKEYDRRMKISAGVYNHYKNNGHHTKTRKIAIHKNGVTSYFYMPIRHKNVQWAGHN